MELAEIGEETKRLNGAEGGAARGAVGGVGVFDRWAEMWEEAKEQRLKVNRRRR